MTNQHCKKTNHGQIQNKTNSAIPNPLINLGFGSWKPFMCPAQNHPELSKYNLHIINYKYLAEQI